MSPFAARHLTPHGRTLARRYLAGLRRDRNRWGGECLRVVALVDCTAMGKPCNCPRCRA